jgi:sulfur transfer protein SufE
MSLESLEKIVTTFEDLPKETRIRELIGLADGLANLEPNETDPWDIKDVRQDHECLDAVGIFAKREGPNVKLAATVGRDATTLTRALTALLVENLNGETLENILKVPNSVINRVVGEALLRQRSNTAYYSLRRIQDVARALEHQTLEHRAVAAN